MRVIVIIASTVVVFVTLAIIIATTVIAILILIPERFCVIQGAGFPTSSKRINYGIVGWPFPSIGTSTRTITGTSTSRVCVVVVPKSKIFIEHRHSTTPDDGAAHFDQNRLGSPVTFGLNSPQAPFCTAKPLLLPPSSLQKTPCTATQLLFI